METTERFPDWPPDDGETIGEARARALVRWVRRHAPPLVAEATRQLRARHGDQGPVETASATAAQLATWSLDPRMRGLAIGTVWMRVMGGDVAMVDIVILRNGRLVLKPGKNMR